MESISGNLRLPPYLEEKISSVLFGTSLIIAFMTLYRIVLFSLFYQIFLQNITVKIFKIQEDGKNLQTEHLYLLKT